MSVLRQLRYSNLYRLELELAAHDEGSASLVTIVVALMLFMVLMLSGGAMQYISIHHQVANAADLSALAGAQNMVLGQDAACQSADVIAAANNATLSACEISDPVSAVEVERWITVWGRLFRISATSRAGAT